MTKNIHKKSIASFLYKGGQKVSKNGAGIFRQHCGKVSVVLEDLSLKICRHSDGKMSVIFILFPRIAEYMRKSPIQFDIPSSYLYVVVLKKLCL